MEAVYSCDTDGGSCTIPTNSVCSKNSVIHAGTTRDLKCTCPSGEVQEFPHCYADMGSKLMNVFGINVFGIPVLKSLFLYL